MPFYNVDLSNVCWWKRLFCWFTFHHKWEREWDDIEGWCESVSEDVCIRCGKSKVSGGGVSTFPYYSSSHW